MRPPRAKFKRLSGQISVACDETKFPDAIQVDGSQTKEKTGEAVNGGMGR